jgi:hypoxanthine phosphoribosyltransferase
MNYQYTIYDFFEHIGSLTRQINDSGKEYDYILAPLRGAAVPAGVLAHRVPGNPRIFAYEGARDHMLSRSTVQTIVEKIHFGKRLLWVDDIVDSGDSLRNFFYLIPSAVGVVDTACLIWNAECGIEPTYWGKQIQRSVSPNYFDFWWESKG